jgi:O-antigen ligase
MFCGLLLFQSALNRKPGMARTLYLAVFMLATLLTFLSFSRASWLGMLLVLLGLLFLYPAFVARIGFIVAPLAIVVVSAGLLSNQLGWANERLYSEEAEGSALDRLPAYFAAIRMLAVKPLFGWGYENFEIYDRPFQGRVLDFRNDNKDHANHSAYLTILAEQGVIGFLLYLGPLLWWLTHTIRTLPRMPPDGFWSKKLLIILWLAILNIFVLNNFTPAWVVYGLGLWWMTLGLIGNLVQRQRAALQYTHHDW